MHALWTAFAILTTGVQTVFCKLDNLTAEQPYLRISDVTQIDNLTAPDWEAFLGLVAADPKRLMVFDSTWVERRQGSKAKQSKPQDAEHSKDRELPQLQMKSRPANAREDTKVRHVDRDQKAKERNEGRHSPSCRLLQTCRVVGD